MLQCEVPAVVCQDPELKWKESGGRESDRRVLATIQCHQIRVIRLSFCRGSAGVSGLSSLIL